MRYQSAQNDTGGQDRRHERNEDIYLHNHARIYSSDRENRQLREQHRNRYTSSRNFDDDVTSHRFRSGNNTPRHLSYSNPAQMSFNSRDRERPIREYLESGPNHGRMKGQQSRNFETLNQGKFRSHTERQRFPPSYHHSNNANPHGFNNANLIQSTENDRFQMLDEQCYDNLEYLSSQDRRRDRHPSSSLSSQADSLYISNLDQQDRSENYRSSVRSSNASEYEQQSFMTDGNRLHRSDSESKIDALGTENSNSTNDVTVNLQESDKDDENKSPSMNRPAADPVTLLQELRQDIRPLCQKRIRRRELLAKIKEQEALVSAADQMVSSINYATQYSRTFFFNFFERIDVIQMIKKRIEAEAGASVAAVFDLCNDLLRLNLVMGILLLAGITIPTLIWQQDDPAIDLDSFNSTYENFSLPKSESASFDFTPEWTTLMGTEDTYVTDQLWGWRTNDDSLSFVLENETSFDCSGIELTDDNLKVQWCSLFYIESQANYTSDRISIVDHLLDFLQGLGFVERTALFIGWYSAELTSSNSYHIALAYFLTVSGAYLISVGYVVRGFGRWLRLSSKVLDYTHLFNNMVFSGWDFNVSNNSTAELEKILLTQEINAAKTEEEFRKERSERTISEARKLFVIRLLIHILTIALIGGGWVGIYFIVTEVRGDSFWEQYATTMTVSGLNFVLPPIFFVLSWFENYTMKSTLLLYIMRNIFLRIISIVILVGSEISSRIEETEDLVNACNKKNPCWETHLAQELYSLIVFDTLIYIPITVSVFVRYLLGFIRDDHPLVRWQPKIIWEFLSQPEFDTAGHVLRAVHLQTLCWMGIVCAPMLPLMTAVAFFIMISLNGITIKYCNLRPSVAFRSSASSSMFMVAAIIGLVLSVVPSALTLTWFEPSLGCSPFRGLHYPYQVIVSAICSTPDWIRDTLFYLAEFLPLALALLVVTSALVYYLAQLNGWQVRERYYEARIKAVAFEKKVLIEKRNLKNNTNSQ